MHVFGSHVSHVGVEIPLVTLGDLCREFGVSRKTGYRWKELFLREGLSGLADQSRRSTTFGSLRQQRSNQLPLLVC